MHTITKSVIRCLSPKNINNEQQHVYYPQAMADYPAICNEDLYTVSYNHAVITWVTPHRASVTTIYAGTDPAKLTKYTFNHNTKYHDVELDNLKPNTLYWYRVGSDDALGPLNSFTTLPKPTGRHLFNYAVFSDNHIASGRSIGDINELYLGKLVEHSHSLLIQCIIDSKRRNIDMAVFTGDITDAADKKQYLDLRDRILPHFGSIPYLVCLGNHDKYTKNQGMGEKWFIEYISNSDTTFASFIFHDYRFILIDSCKQNNNWGYVEPSQLHWIKDTLSNENKPAYLFLHHPCNGPDIWFGVKNHLELQKTINSFDCVQGVFCGHMHRNKVTYNRQITGYMPYIEVPATVQFPCAYGIVQVFEQGFVYNSYKVSRLDLSELSRSRFILKKGGKAFVSRYCLGNLGDRCFAFVNNRIYRPLQYELSISTGQKKAAVLYQQALLDDGASITYGNKANNYRIILGSHDASLGLSSNNIC